MKLYHATSTKHLESILNEGYISHNSYWADNIELAEYYMETIEDEGEQPILLSIKTNDTDVFSPDMPGIEEPIATVVGLSDNEVWERWEESSKTWEDSLEIIGSVIINNVVPVDRLSLVDKDNELPLKIKHKTSSSPELS